MTGRTGRFNINPGPLRIYHGKRQEEDPNAGRCEAELKDGSGRCLNDAVREVAGRQLCGVHARFALRQEGS